MTAAEFTSWRDHSVRSYARERARATGNTMESELRSALRGSDVHFPDGIDTVGVRLLVTLDETGERTGILWLGPHPSKPGAWWVYEIEIDEARRGQGHGRAAMLAAEVAVDAAGGTELGLNVFGLNTPARALYESLGYRTVSVEMEKEVGRLGDFGQPGDQVP